MRFLLVSSKEAISPISVTGEFFSHHIDFAQKYLGLMSPDKRRNTERTTTKSQQPMS